MGIEGSIPQKISGQEGTIALNEGFVASEGNKIVQDKEPLEKLDEKVVIEKFLSSNKEQAKTTKQLLGQLINTVASTGVKLSDNILDKVNKNVKDEYDLLLKTEGQSSEDVSTISTSQLDAIKKMGKNNRHGGGNQGEKGEGGNSAVSEKTGAVLKEYSTLYSQFLMNGGSELKKKIEELEVKLKESGVNPKDLLSIQNSIRKSIRSEIASQVKDLYLKRIMSNDKSVESVINNKALNDLLDTTYENKKLGGGDFGGYLDDLQGTLNEKAREVGDEMRTFLKEELESKFTKKTIFNDVPDEEIFGLLKLGAKVGFRAGEFFMGWQKTMNDIGLIPVPQSVAAQSAGGASSGFNNKKENQNTGYEFDTDDQKDLMINQLRALYMLRSVKGDLRTKIETSFKIRKLKNGLVRLGVNFIDMEKIEKEGNAIARAKLLEMLKEAFYERATLYELSGPAFELIEKKIKGVLRNLENIGVKLEKIELDSIRDDANHKMYDVVKSEFEHDEALYKSMPTPGIEKKVKLLVKLLKRLQEESKIDLEYHPEKDIAVVRSAA